MSSELVKAAILYSHSYRVLHTFVTSTLEPFGLTPMRWAFLLTILQQPNLSLKEYALILSIDPPFISQLIDEMSAAKLLHMVHNSEDKRKKMITLTEKGQKLAHESVKTLETNLSTFFANADQADLDAHLRILRYIIGRGS